MDAVRVSRRTQIWELAVDILDHISSYLPGGSVLSFWISGDARLRYLLENGGVSSLTLEYRRLETLPETFKASRFPLGLSSFRGLKHLKFDCGQHLIDDIHVVRTGLQSCSSKLETLSLKCRYAELVLLSESTDLEQSEADEAIEGNISNICGRSRMWPIAEHFSKLKSLEIISKRTPGGLRNQDFSGLPASLTELRYLVPNSAVNESVLRHLSPQLRKLSFQFALTESAIRALPSGLEYLDYLGMFDSSWLPILPQHLVCSHLRLYRFRFEDLPLIPLGVRSLSLLASFSTGFISKLPDHVTSIQMQSGWLRSVQSEHFFPSQLLHLRIAGFLDPRNLRWPKALKTLTVGSFVFSASTPAFPTVLEEFTTFLQCEHISDLNQLVKMLPSTLKLLNLSVVTSSKSKYPGHLELPSTLTSLHLRQIEYCQPLFDSLPETLTSLWIEGRPGNDEMQDGWISLLPSSLTLLELIFTCCSAACLTMMPEGLTRLVIDVGGKASQKEIESLPPSLQILNLPSLLTFEGEDFQAFPRGLHSLHLERFNGPIALTNLPPKIQILTAPHAEIRPDALGVAALPRSMHTLHLKDSAMLALGLNPAVAPYLPL
jgi:hypothetical protein